MRSHSFVVSSIFTIVVVMMMALTSCSSDYHNVIPANSTAVMSLDMKRLMSDAPAVSDKHTKMLKMLFDIDDISDCGINFKENIYVFETPDGSIGIVASVDNQDDLESWLKKLSDKGICSEITKRKGFCFTVFNDSFIVGFSDNAVLVMGPVVTATQSKVLARMVKYLGADDSEGITGTQLYDKLSSLDGSVTLVVQAQALPEKLVAPFVLGVPSKASKKDLFLSASMTIDNGVLNLTGEIFSFDKEVNDALKSSALSYKPVSDKYIDYISAKSLITALCGINGEDFVSRMRDDEQLRAMLIGLNTAIDIDMMLKSIDGDMLISIPSLNGDRFDFQMIADAYNGDWLSDVGYWKESVPCGSKITDGSTTDCYCLNTPDMNLYFGLKDNKQLFLSTTDTDIKPAVAPLSDSIKKSISGKRFCLIVNVEEFSRQKAELKAIKDMATPILGNVKMVVLSIK